ncbi:hypothetical protein PROFUN_15971 [Planoprotostelium fungivorum]|uniref:Protein kinase domain-containing protein n=1 Tax=Planoprotostelium fungivorum TaxID=1890364 RepID=A0A2P6MTY2_9EUKA|nr:hypothetical protein PROFUN_15971 [Planoprotostelium fungivorum]
MTLTQIEAKNMQVIRFAKSFKYDLLTQDVRDLIVRILSFDANKRPSIEEIITKMHI